MYALLLAAVLFFAALTGCAVESSTPPPIARGPDAAVPADGIYCRVLAGRMPEAESERLRHLQQALWTAPAEIQDEWNLVAAGARAFRAAAGESPEVQAAKARIAAFEAAYC